MTRQLVHVHTWPTIGYVSVECQLKREFTSNLHGMMYVICASGRNSESSSLLLPVQSGQTCAAALAR